MKTIVKIVFLVICMSIGLGTHGHTSNKTRETYFQMMYSNKEQISASIQKEMNELEQKNYLEFQGEKILSKHFLPRFYKERDYGPAWTNFDSFNEAIEAIESSTLDGLLPTDYHADALRAIGAQIKGIASQDQLDYRWVAQFDILLSDALFLYAYHLYNGKTDPHLLDINWNFKHRDLPEDAPKGLSTAIYERSLSPRLNALRPSNPGYRFFMVELAGYMKIAGDGGWGTIADTGKIEPGDHERRIPKIRKRLHLTNDLSHTEKMESTIYDKNLEKDIKSFQSRHGLYSDGIIGKRTFAALNVPVEEKIDMLRVNMERSRWVMHDAPEDFLIVNIPRFKAYVVNNNSVAYETNVMVGKTYHKTPVFRSKLQYLEFNPTWTVPVSITRKEMIPKIKKDPGYLKKKNFSIVDRSGNTVDQSTIDFAAISANNFPYTIRQEAGPWNALGVVKFIFPNKHSVYLHDTQAKSLFGKTERTFSHGCIRVQNPLDLAEVLLQGTNWDRNKIDEQIASKKTKRVRPKQKLDIFLLYWTAGLHESGKLFYVPDVYERDRPILEMLNQQVSSVWHEDF